MTRSRAPVNGGYVRKTVCLPASLVDRIQLLREQKPGLTMSAFITEAAELLVTKKEKGRER